MIKKEMATRFFCTKCVFYLLFSLLLFQYQSSVTVFCWFKVNIFIVIHLDYDFYSDQVFNENFLIAIILHNILTMHFTLMLLLYEILIWLIMYRRCNKFYLLILLCKVDRSIVYKCYNNFLLLDLSNNVNRLVVYRWYNNLSSAFIL
jgi:hypothetical protein